METELEWEDLTPEELSEKFEDFQDDLMEELESALEDVVLKAEREAKHRVNVDTGRLRSSIESTARQISETIVEGLIGSNVYYAPFQEVIDPYLRPAIEENLDYAEERIKEAVEMAWENSR